MSPRCAVGLAALVLLLLPAAAQARLGLGLQDDRLFLGPPVTSDRAAGWTVAAGLHRAQQLGVQTLKLGVPWERVVGADEGAPLALSRYDEVVDAARARGLSIHLAFRGPAPSWATGDHRTSNVTPDPVAFGRFAARVGEHFRGRVAEYSTWNEPNWHGHLVPLRTAGDQYRRLHVAGERALRRSDPAALVLFGELAPLGEPEAAVAPLRFLRQATCSDRSWRAARYCAPLVADGFALHPYTLRWAPDFPGRSADDVTTGSLGRLHHPLAHLAARGALRTPKGRASMPLFLSEWGWHARSRRIPPAARSAMLARGLRLIASDPRVREVTWYQLVSPPSLPRPPWDTGLVLPDGRPRPAFEVLRRWFAPAQAPAR